MATVKERKLVIARLDMSRRELEQKAGHENMLDLSPVNLAQTAVAGNTAEGEGVDVIQPLFRLLQTS